jgi:hypothetical protein
MKVIATRETHLTGLNITRGLRVTIRGSDVSKMPGKREILRAKPALRMTPSGSFSAPWKRTANLQNEGGNI